MSDLSGYSIEQLKAEIVRKESEQLLATEEAPKPVENPDFSPLIEMVKDYMKEVAKGGYVDDDFDHYIYETAVMCVFGNNIFSYINTRR